MSQAGGPAPSGTRRLAEPASSPAAPARLPSRRRTALAFVALLAASAIIRWLPFRRVMDSAAGRSRRPAPAPEARRLLVAQARWAVERCARALPWRTLCFEKGLALHWLLRRQGIASHLHYGIGERTADSLSAHVWVSVDGAIVIGAGAASRHACVMIRPDPTDARRQ